MIVVIVGVVGVVGIVGVGGLAALAGGGPHGGTWLGWGRYAARALVFLTAGRLHELKPVATKMAECTMRTLAMDLRTQILCEFWDRAPTGV